MKSLEDHFKNSDVAYVNKLSENEIAELAFIARQLIAYHVEAALKAAYEKGNIVCPKGENYNCLQCMGGACEESIIDKDSILNAYQLDQIQ